MSSTSGNRLFNESQAMAVCSWCYFALCRLYLPDQLHICLPSESLHALVQSIHTDHSTAYHSSAEQGNHRGCLPAKFSSCRPPTHQYTEFHSLTGPHVGCNLAQALHYC